MANEPTVMTAFEYIRELNRAEGFIELSMPADAWEVLQALPGNLKMRSEVLLLRVKVLLTLGYEREAEALARDAVAFAPTSGPALFCLALTQAQLGNRASAKEALSAALLLDGNIRDAVNEALCGL